MASVRLLGVSWLRKGFQKIPRRLLDASWEQFGPSQKPTWLQLGSQDANKMVENRCHNRLVIGILRLRKGK